MLTRDGDQPHQLQFGFLAWEGQCREGEPSPSRKESRDDSRPSIADRRSCAASPDCEGKGNRIRPSIVHYCTAGVLRKADNVQFPSSFRRSAGQQSKGMDKLPQQMRLTGQAATFRRSGGVRRSRRSRQARTLSPGKLRKRQHVTKIWRSIALQPAS